MNAPNSTTERPAETDGLYDTSPAGLIRHYGARAVAAMCAGAHARGYGRMVASLAFQQRPDLRESATKGRN